MNTQDFTTTLFFDCVYRKYIDPAALTTISDQAFPRTLCKQASQQIKQWDGYRATPLLRLGAMAARLGLAELWCKDEGGRFGLGSFKALGGAYAVNVLARQAHNQLTVACATEGNHGRSVAWGAQQAGARCVIFLHENVSASREEAISAYGAQIRRIKGNYDDAVRACAEISEQEGWTIVSDTTWEGYETIPQIVMAGYSVIVDEMVEQLADAPTHVFLQAGVGGMAAAIMTQLARFYGDQLPSFIIVEPRNAACVLASLRAGGQLNEIKGKLETISAGLACGAPSPLALSIIQAGARAAVAVDDSALIAAMRQLAQPLGDDQHIVAGASGAAGLAGLSTILKVPELASAVGLTSTSRVLCINTESDTDPEAYRRHLAC